MNTKLTWNQRGRLWFRLVIRSIIAVIVCLVAINFGKTLISLFMPFILAIILAMILNPLIDKIQLKTKIKRNKVTLLLIVSISIISGILIYMLAKSIVLEILQLVGNIDTILEGFTASVDSAELAIQKLLSKMHLEFKLESGSLMEKMMDTVVATVKSFAVDTTGLAEFAKQRVSGAAGIFVSVLVFIMASYFITADYQKICKNFSNILGTDLSKVLNQIKSIFISAFGGYIRARVIVALGVGFIEFIGFMIIGQQYALLLAMVMAILDFIPIIGSGTVIVPWAIICLVTGHIGYGLKLFIIYGVITVFRNIAEPKAVGNQTGLSSILSLITIYVGMKLAGIVGMILGPVLTMTIINMLKIGIFRNTINDIKLAVSDISSILSSSGDKTI